MRCAPSVTAERDIARMSRGPSHENRSYGIKHCTEARKAGFGRILVLSGDREARRALTLMLEADGFLTYPFSSIGALLEIVGCLEEESSGWCCLLMADDVRKGGIGSTLLFPLRSADKLIPIVVLVDDLKFGHEEDASFPYQAVWYANPFLPDDILLSVRQALGEMEI